MQQVLAPIEPKKIRNLPRGENHWAWKGGVTSQNSLDRSSYKSKAWRATVFERDNYTCQKCQKRGCYLQAHHIQPFALFPELRFELSNGITLCRKCHSKEPRHQHIYTGEQRAKIGSANRGKKRSDQTKEKLRQAALGKTPWNKGIKTGRNDAVSAARTGNTPWNKGAKKREDIACICGKKFFPPKQSSRFCSKSCAMQNNNRAIKHTLLEKGYETDESINAEFAAT